MKKILLISLLTITSGCTEFALLASGASLAANQNIYARTYSGIDVLTIMSTEKDIKTHIYTKTKDLINEKRR